MNSMPRRMTASFFVLISIPLPAVGAAQTGAAASLNTSENAAKLTLREIRSSPLDLEVTGALAGLPVGTTRFVRRDDLSQLPQVSLTVTDDPNFRRTVNVRGVELELLARALASSAEKSVIVALCVDRYRSYYPQSYREIHKPVLVLEIDNQPPSAWPQNPEVSGLSMGPYLVTQSNFAPAFTVLGHADEAQIPWGVVQLEFRNPETAFASIAPHGPGAENPAVQAGYRISQQNCLRCHGPESEEPLKGKLTWAGISSFAAQAPKNFAAYVRNPKALSQDAKMPPNPSYDAATLDALIAYFKTFVASGTP